MTDPTNLLEDLEAAGMKAQIWTDDEGRMLALILGSRKPYEEADRIAREHGVTWVSQASNPQKLGFPTLVATSNEESNALPEPVV